MPWQHDLLQIVLSGQAFYFPMDGISRAQAYGKQRVMDWLEVAAEMDLLGHIHIIKRDETLCYGHTPPCDLSRRTDRGVAGPAAVAGFHDEIASQP